MKIAIAAQGDFVGMREHRWRQAIRIEKKEKPSEKHESASFESFAVINAC